MKILFAATLIVLIAVSGCINGGVIKKDSQNTNPSFVTRGSCSDCPLSDLAEIGGKIYFIEDGHIISSVEAGSSVGKSLVNFIPLSVNNLKTINGKLYFIEFSASNDAVSDILTEYDPSTGSLKKILEYGGNSVDLEKRIKDYMIVDGKVFWIAGKAPIPNLKNKCDSGIYYSSLDGSEEETFISPYGCVSSLATDGNFIYWADGTDEIKKLGKAGGTIEKIKIEGEAVQRIIFDGTDIIWVGKGVGVVRDGKAKILYEKPILVAGGGDYIYIPAFEKRAILKISKITGLQSTLVSNMKISQFGRIYSIGTFGGDVYWVEGNEIFKAVERI